MAAALASRLGLAIKADEGLIIAWTGRHVRDEKIRRPGLVLAPDAGRIRRACAGRDPACRERRPRPAERVMPKQEAPGGTRDCDFGRLARTRLGRCFS
jgi:hypothetical protein